MKNETLSVEDRLKIIQQIDKISDKYHWPYVDNGDYAERLRKIFENVCCEQEGKHKKSLL